MFGAALSGIVALGQDDDTQQSGRGIRGEWMSSYKVKAVVHARFLVSSSLVSFLSGRANTATASFQNPRSSLTTRAWHAVPCRTAGWLLPGRDIYILFVIEHHLSANLVMASPRAVVTSGSGRGPLRSRLLEALWNPDSNGQKTVMPRWLLCADLHAAMVRTSDACDSVA